MSEKAIKAGRYFFLGGILLIFCVLTSCVNNTELKYFGDQITLLHNKTNELEKSKLSKNELETNPRLQSIHNKQAEMVVEIDQLKRSGEVLAARVDDNDLVLKRMVERDLNTKEGAAGKLDDLVRRINRLEALAKLQQQYLNLEEPATWEEEKEREDTGSPPAGERETAPPSQVTEKPAGEVELYDFYLAAFQENQYEKAMDGFREFIKTYPKSDRADNAQFWIGECFMALKQYEQAILAYQKVIKDYPQGNKVANAMLRQAVAFMELNDKTSARLLLQRVIKNYPNSSEAVIAGKRLETIK